MPAASGTAMAMTSHFGTQGSARRSKHRPIDKQKPAPPIVARANKRLASRVYHGGHCLTGRYLQWTTRRRMLVAPVQQRWESQQETLWATVLGETRKHPGRVRTRDRTEIAGLFADERCSKAILDFLATTDVGKTAGPLVAAVEGEAGGEVSAWENRERSHRWRRKRQGWVGGMDG